MQSLNNSCFLNTDPVQVRLVCYKRRLILRPVFLAVHHSFGKSLFDIRTASPIALPNNGGTALPI